MYAMHCDVTILVAACCGLDPRAGGTSSGGTCFGWPAGGTAVYATHCDVAISLAEVARCFVSESLLAGAPTVVAVLLSSVLPPSPGCVKMWFRLAQMTFRFLFLDCFCNLEGGKGGGLIRPQTYLLI